MQILLIQTIFVSLLYPTQVCDRSLHDGEYRYTSYDTFLQGNLGAEETPSPPRMRRGGGMGEVKGKICCNRRDGEERE